MKVYVLLAITYYEGAAILKISEDKEKLIKILKKAKGYTLSKDTDFENREIAKAKRTSTWSTDTTHEEKMAFDYSDCLSIEEWEVE